MRLSRFQKFHSALILTAALSSNFVLNLENADAGLGSVFKKVVKEVKRTPGNVVEAPKKTIKEIKRIPDNLKSNPITKPLGELGEEAESTIRKANDTQKRVYREVERSVNHFFKKVEDETGVTIGDGVKVETTIELGDTKSTDTTNSNSSKAEPNRTFASTNVISELATSVSSEIPGAVLNSNMKSFLGKLAILETELKNTKVPNNPDHDLSVDIARFKLIQKEVKETEKVVRDAVKVLNQKEGAIIDSNGLYRYDLVVKLQPQLNRINNEARKRQIEFEKAASTRKK